MNEVDKSREPIFRLKGEMLKLPQIELPTDHYFADGMYCRVLFRPAQTLIVGKIHKKEHFYVVCSGIVQITNGDEIAREITGPAVIVSKPGTMRAVYAKTDATCLTVHRLDEPTTEIEDVEDQLVHPDKTSLYGPGNTLRIAA